MCHVIFVSGCLTDSCRYQLILIRMAYITDRLVSICARSNVTIDIDLHVVGVVRAPRHNQIFLPMVLCWRARGPLLNKVYLRAITMIITLPSVATDEFKLFQCLNLLLLK